MAKSNQTDNLLREALDVLMDVPCQFWACEGPTLRPVAMITCRRCEAVAKLAKRLGCYTPRKERNLEKDNPHVPVGGWYNRS